MRSTSLLVALAALAAACGSGDPKAAGAASIAISGAMSSSLASANGTVKFLDLGDLALGSVSERDLAELGRALPELAKAAPGSNVSCTAGCQPNGSGGWQSPTATSRCTFSGAADACTGGGTVAASGTVDVTMTCGTMASKSDFSFSLQFSNCGSNGVTLNSGSGPLTISGSMDLQSGMSATVKATGLQVKGSICGSSLNETCDMDYTIKAQGQSYTFTGQVCGCDVSKLAESQDICKASC